MGAVSWSALALMLVAQTQPFTSFRKLTSANGWAPVVVDLEQRRVTVFRENMYRYPAPGLETRNLAYDVYLGIRAGGQSRWLTDVRLDEAGYESGTNLVRTVQRTDGLRITTTYFAPFSLPARAFVVTALVTAERDVEGVALFSLHNLHLGGGVDRTTGETIAWDGRALIERGTGSGAAVIVPLTPAAHRTASPANPFTLVTQNQPFADALPSGPIDDLVSGLQFDAGRMTMGSTQRFAFVVGWAPDGNATALEDQILAWQAGRVPDALLADERVAWSAWQREGTRPIASDAAEMQVSSQSLAILRMGQVLETGAPNGQMIASLPPGQWDVAWLRDGMLAVNALIETGHLVEAEKALDFYLRGPVGDYQMYVGRSYALSVCRYYGNGREESDSNARGPNVELDGFGLYLEAVARFAGAAPNGPAWALRHMTQLNDGVADVLVDFRDPVTGLVAAESSIWESHWDSGGRQRWVFTSGTAVIGLLGWADVLEAIAPGDPHIARYRTRAAEIRDAMEMHLVDPITHALGASVEQLSGSTFADAQAALILGPSTFPAGEIFGLATLDLLKRRLFLSNTTRRGYKRNDDGDLYDEREWAVIDLGIAKALRAANRPTEADALIGWITGQATQNFGIVPELFDQTDARYAGEAPMIGFGAGAYLRALIDRSGSEPFDPITRPDAGAPQDAAEMRPEFSDLLPSDGFVDAGGPLDAAASDPDAETRDAAARPDAGIMTLARSGCGCTTGGDAASPLGLVSLMFLRTTAARRSRRAPRPAPRTAPPA